MSSKANKDGYEEMAERSSPFSGALKVGLISAASAVAGGLAAAWWYRKTLNKLQNPIMQTIVQKSEYLDEDSDGL